MQYINEMVYIIYAFCSQCLNYDYFKKTKSGAVGNWPLG